ncbi:tRNA pseudouridine38-40 synthase [Pustulibacterium marinum]|uniref:tRNA pseudouridine synthase A n=1 Tax=Pustulibacterium marinum TaxID=1224947 RepID=A0A1I7FDS1_9FLAO|nr:tRNA pseudouridine(38-40) synthase TruA [Pustulibacterium marinum]SFU34329.1 tRNA pseudouridine38-40 synthase [Pustulibacterium marinum]
MRYFLEFSYNGADYHGWQNQPNAISVQEVLEKALSTLLRKEIAITGAGRTDAGVHAKQMFAHFDVESVLDQNLIYKLNSYLPKSIAIHNLHLVADDAHARFDAESRTYEYWIVTKKDPFLNEFAYCLKYPLDVDLMNEAAKVLFEYKDFQCFSKSNTDVKTYLCDLMHAEWKWQGEKLVFTIQADRFLRNMVRAVVGTLLNVGSGKITIVDVRKIVESKDRSNAGVSVPAHALYLTKVIYPYIKN